MRIQDVDFAPPRYAAITERRSERLEELGESLRWIKACRTVDPYVDTDGVLRRNLKTQIAYERRCLTAAKKALA